jgi:hypothetical protein
MKPPARSPRRRQTVNVQKPRRPWPPRTPRSPWPWLPSSKASPYAPKSSSR